ncbi:hypothetical protein L7F22_057494 [Adiantum nelumboides]|nr:hypothetical protein [Adiantum nelumboides]
MVQQNGENFATDQLTKISFLMGHFDFETVLNAKMRPLAELPEKSYVGFFQLNSLEDGCDYLQGAMSFDSIWEEVIIPRKQEGHPAIYVVSWNDHFLS